MASASVDVKEILAKGSKKNLPSTAVGSMDGLVLDAGHLYAFDPSPVDEVALSSDHAAAHLVQCARAAAQLLTNELCGSQSDKGIIPLPPPELKLPREKPLPVEKASTRWDKFAKQKGIVKQKRSKHVWDEATQQWAPRYGYGRAKSAKSENENWVVEAKPGDDGSVDPFEKRADDKKAKKGTQKRQEERNRLEAAAAGDAAGGKSRAEQKAKLKRAIAAAQSSTASMGRFDPQLRNEPSRTAGKRKRYETGVGAADMADDAARVAAVVAKKHAKQATGR